MLGFLDYFMAFWSYVTSSREVVPPATTVKKKPFKSTVPSQPKNYIDRRLHGRNIITKDIFQTASSLPDIFILDGIQAHKLALMAKGELVGRTCEQLGQDEIIARFLILDKPSHFDLIIAKIKNKQLFPIHLLRYLGGGLWKWVRTVGDASDLLHYIDENPDHYSRVKAEEHDIYKDVAKSTDSNRHFCLTGGAGSGKTALLAGFATNLAKDYPNRRVIFFPARKFICKIKRAKRSSTNKSNQLSTVLENLTGKSKLDLETPSDFETIGVELFLDGLNELNLGDLNLALKMLQNIRSTYKAIRLWVTTRPHLMNQLELALGSPFEGYSLKPLRWCEEMDIICTQISLDNVSKYFSMSCQTATQYLSQNPRLPPLQIWDSPAECQILGQIIEEEFFLIEQPCWSVILPKYFVRSVELKLKQYRSVHGRSSQFLQEEDVMLLHARLCIQGGFPKYFKNIFPQTQAVSLHQEIFKFGLVKNSDQREISIREGFAEYFVAWYILYRIESGNWNKVLSQVVMHMIMGTDFEWYVKSGRTNQKCSMRLACTLLDFLLGTHKASPVDPIHFKHVWVEVDIYEMADFCARHNFRHIFNCFNQVGRNIPLRPWGVQRILLMIIENGSMEFLNDAISTFENLEMSFTTENKLSLFDGALRRGNFSIVDYLIKRLNLQDLVKGKSSGIEDTGHFIHSSIELSKLNSEVQITEKIQLLRLLVKMDPSIIKKKKPYMEHALGTLIPQEPLLCPNVHVRLLAELVDLGADVIAKTKDGETILHINSEMSSEDYEILVSSIPEKKLRQLANVKDSKGQTALACYFKNRIGPSPRTLETFKKAGYDFKGDEETSILNEAVKLGDLLAIGKLLCFQPDLGEWRGSKGETLLHVAVTTFPRHNVYDVVELLLKNGAHVDAIDYDGNTPLHSLIGGPHIDQWKSKVLQSLVKHGANPNAVNKQGDSPIHIACDNVMYFPDEFLEVFLIVANDLLDNGANIFAKDQKDRNFLHKLFEEYPDIPYDSNTSSIEVAFVNSITCSEFTHIMNFIIGRDKMALFNIWGGQNSYTPLQLALKNFELDVETLSILHQSGADFKVVDRHGKSVLTYAEEGLCSPVILTKIKEFMRMDS